MTERGRLTATYLGGYAAALVLTLAAFAAVRWPIAGAGTTLAIIMGLALVQLIVQLRCFLHVSVTQGSRITLLLVLFSSLVIALMVAGTLVVIFNLHARMM
ncbi:MULTISPECIES: cytochrome C oxidase subunit IV family protein [unclassified Sphingomonas]|jgi:cytochrome o ubiquinol oxidase subunit IV|uniref:cytochrome C oxidase subunit IV family protein n=1 Tax=unclassified Sphingomonas TaxID=196159 RepID=UPI000E10AFF4|nr:MULTISPECIES: cytochrome C oxidase subunit IV family protein [unclassified Sphingomonas]AXJ95054.1 cytochrome-c oxidase [Sphingomonas sp. FARSPH]